MRASRATDSLVVKLGGRALESPDDVCAFARELAALGGAVVLVHGGGAEVSSWCGRLGLAPRFEQGLRVTDEATLEVATAVLAGLANKRLVAALRAHDIDAVGLAALDGGTLAVRPHAEAATLGCVGEVCGADPALLAALLAQGRTPVIASIGATSMGALLNLNADDAAAALAVALGAQTLLLLSDTPGVRLAGAIVPTLHATELAALLAHPEVRGGMVPKLRAAQTALSSGVGRALIGAWAGEGSLAALLAGTACTTLLAGAGHLSPEETHA